MKTPFFASCLLILLACVATSSWAASDTAPESAEALANGVLGTVEGEQVYSQICQGCHMPGGRGAIGAGYYPKFVDNPTLVSAQYMAATILNGRRNMPSFAHRAHFEFFFSETWLSDIQIANVINYIRSHFGNHYTDAISAADVAALHAKESER